MISFWFHWFSPLLLSCVVSHPSLYWGLYPQDEGRELFFSSLIFIAFFLWWLPSIVRLTHPGRAWRTSKVKLTCGRLVCRELSWSLIIVRRPSPLWVEASLGGLNKKAGGRWARVWNSKLCAYTRQVQFLSELLPWLPLMTNLWPMRWTVPFPNSCRKGPGIFGPGVYQNKGHSVFSPCLCVGGRLISLSSPVCFSVLWRPWLSFISNYSPYISCPFFLH